MAGTSGALLDVLHTLSNEVRELGVVPNEIARVETLTALEFQVLKVL